MKKFLVAAVFLGLASAAIADIHVPPKSKYTSTRKLSRGLSNILYSWIELPVTIWRANERGDQATEIIFNSTIQGLERTGTRLVYGLYEVVNFHKPIYKDSYRPPYKNINYDPVFGYEEFPPQLGQLSTVHYTRGVSW